MEAMEMVSTKAKPKRQKQQVIHVMEKKRSGPVRNPPARGLHGIIAMF